MLFEKSQNNKIKLKRILYSIDKNNSKTLRFVF